MMVEVERRQFRTWRRGCRAPRSTVDCQGTWIIDPRRFEHVSSRDFDGTIEVSENVCRMGAKNSDGGPQTSTCRGFPRIFRVLSSGRVRNCYKRRDAGLSFHTRETKWRGETTFQCSKETRAQADAARLGRQTVATVFLGPKRRFARWFRVKSYCGTLKKPRRSIHNRWSSMLTEGVCSLPRQRPPSRLSCDHRKLLNESGRDSSDFTPSWLLSLFLHMEKHTGAKRDLTMTTKRKKTSTTG